MTNTDVGKLRSETLKHSPDVNSLLKISLGLILFTIISFALVYAETMSVEVDGTSYDVEYTETELTVSSIVSDLDFISLTIAVDVPDSTGTLDITFERSFFDSIDRGLDDDFIVLVDADEPNFTETDTTSQSRTLSIELPIGTEEIEIFGSTFGGSSVEEPPVEIPEPPVEIPEPPVEIPEPPEKTSEVPVEKKPDIICDSGTILEDGKCVLDKRCGDGTILEDGKCVLDKRCGDGTILKDGKCVLDSTSQSSGSSSAKGVGIGLGMGFVAAFVIAGIVGIILGLVAKASKS